MKTRETSLDDRLKTAAKATQERLERARAGDPSKKVGFAQDQEARLAAATARNNRIAEQRAEKRAADLREASEQAAAKAKELAASEAEATALAARLDAERKAARDARYAARKVRSR